MRKAWVYKNSQMDDAILPIDSDRSIIQTVNAQQSACTERMNNQKMFGKVKILHRISQLTQSFTESPEQVSVSSQLSLC